MRRFELRGLSSRKFWEVAVEGSACSTRWGRIGSEGKTSTKVLGDAGAAHAELDRLVREKLREGYAEVTLDDSVVRWTEKALATVYRGRAAASQRRNAPTRVDPEAVWPILIRAFDRTRERWQQGEEAASPQLRARMEAVRRSFRDADARALGSPEVEGARAILLTDYDGLEKSNVVSAVLVPLWMCEKGPAFAVEAMLQAATVCRHWLVRPGREAAWYLTEAPALGVEHRRFQVWGALRHELAAVEEGPYLEARDVAGEARGAADLSVRCALSFLFPTEVAWADADARDCVSAAKPPESRVLLLASRCVRAEIASIANDRQALIGIELALLHTVLDSRGALAVPVLLSVAEHEAVVAARALSLVETPEVAAAFERWRDDPKLRAIAQQYLGVAPKLPDDEVARAWARIESWLERRDPETLEGLAAGAKDAELARLDAETGLRAPDDLRSLLRVHNGEATPVGALGDFELCSIDEIIDAVKLFREIHERQGGLPDPDVPPGVQPVFWCTSWLPFASVGDGSYLCLDLDPADGGRAGQVLFYGHGEGVTSIEAPSLLDWLLRRAADLEKGGRLRSDEGAV